MHHLEFFSSSAVRCRVAVVAAGFAVLLGACSSHTVRMVDTTQPKQLDDISEDMLLDVGIAVFNANVPVAFDDQVAQNISPDVRRAEANYMAFYTKDLLQSTGNWGAVRVVPRPTHAVDVMVGGTIVHSDGERMILATEVRDARGVAWFANTYEALASKYAYGDTVPPGTDPFQSIYRRLADDMVTHLQTLEPSEVSAIRRTAEMKFASDLSPEAFQSYVVQTEPGVFEIRRLPAEDDPMLQRIRKVREREYIFIDTLDTYYDDFHLRMYPAYQGWRGATYDEAIAYRNQREKVRRQALAGVIAITAGSAAQMGDRTLTRYAGAVSIIGGARTAIKAIESLDRAKAHAGMLRELGMSAEAAITPHTIELENRTHRLEGTVTAQYDELRQVLRRIYYQELGLPPPADDSSADDLENAVAEAAAASEELAAVVEATANPGALAEGAK